MAQMDLYFLWLKDELHFDLCSDYLYLLLIFCSLFHESPICDPVLTETTITIIHTKYHDRKASWRPFTASIKPVEDSLRNFNTTSTVFLHV